MAPTFLRIKRRRTDDPLPYIRLQALNRPGELPLQLSNKKRERPGSQSEGNFTDLDSTSLNEFCNSQNAVESQSSKSSGPSVLWKRVEPSVEETHSSCRVVDALLEQSSDGDNIDSRQTKRRKLTLLDTTNSISGAKSLGFPSPRSSSQRKSPLKVLDPLTRMVDDNLQQVHIGLCPIADHFRLVTMDRRLVSSQDPKKWLSWCHSSGGNLLHACALWNDMEMAGALLKIPNSAGPLCEALDGDGRTPYEVAQLSGHDSVCEVLEAFGGDTTNFVYDIFCLDEGNGDQEKDGEDSPMSVELTDGVAYWTPAGELLLETTDKISAYVEDDDDGEIDSNCEDYDANDYPDEEEEDVAWGYDDRGYDFADVGKHNQEACALDRNLYQHRSNGSYDGQESIGSDDDVDPYGGW